MTELTVRQLTELSLDECWRRLALASVGRLAVNNGNRPDIFPVNYLLDGDRIVIRTAEGTKLAAAVASAAVAFEIDEIDTENEQAWSVVVHGVAQEPRSLASVMHDQELPLHPWTGDAGKERFIEIVPVEISGRAVGSAD